ncbi:MAG: hypothetical protein LBF12_02415, partial [Christensenellaceae bacterium]|nr:hypothetical protein [Christensenellaceae bacterium]
KIAPLDEIIIEGDITKTRVKKMSFANKSDKSTIIFNSDIVIKNIPLEAYDYVLNARSAIEHVMVQYQVSKDEESGIEIDPNKWCDEVGDPSYILNLLLSVISVSVKTLKIIKEMPYMDFSDLNENLD